MAELTRRAFLQLTAGGGAALAAGMASKRYDRLLSYVAPAAQSIPGENTTYVTTCRECPAGCGMYATHRDGRVLKVEGNPDCPIGRGGLCPRGQSAVQGLYDPDRVKSPLRLAAGGEASAVTWREAVGQIGREIADSGGRVMLLSDLQTGPLAELMQGLAVAWGGSAVFYEPFNYEPIRLGMQDLFGQDILPRYNLEGCQFILSFWADFLESWISPVEFTAQYVRSGGQGPWAAGVHPYRQSRCVYVGPRLSMTAANADEYIQAPPGQGRAVALAMLKVMIERKLAVRDVSFLKAGLDAMGSALDHPAGLSQDKLVELAETFCKASSSAALAGPVGANGHASRHCVMAAMLLNYAAGRIGQTVLPSQPCALGRTASTGQWRQFLEGLGGKDTLIIHEANPAYACDKTVSHLRRAGRIVYLGTHRSETANLAQWVLPVDSPLESWGVYEPYRGQFGMVQPAMSRLHDTKAAGDVLLALADAAGKPIAAPEGKGVVDSFQRYVRSWWERTQREMGGKGDDTLWQEHLRRGFFTAPAEKSPAKPLALRKDMVLPTLGLPSTRPADEFELIPWASSLWHDGRLANRGWLQEAPDPISTVVWGNWLDIHPTTADAYGLSDGDIAAVDGPGSTIYLSVRKTTGVHETCLAAALGQGHTALGRVAQGRGANVFRLLTALPQEDAFVRVKLAKTDRHDMFIYMSDSQQQFGREILQWAGLGEVRSFSPGQGDKLRLPLPEGYDDRFDLYPKRNYKGHRWAMVVDLDRCTGCGACSVACYAENNLPVVGAEACRKGREMAWLKVTPYWDKSQRRQGYLPLPCMQCDAAPCEPVCPVFAAVHTAEGLNAQVYNRCIGTRYCSNNCPYKVRRFNWLETRWESPLEMQLNPDVSVRCRGVMEKCTFCIQRIHAAELAAKHEGRPVRDGEIVPACAQTCPAKAIVFGDLTDEKALVTQLTRKDPRRYHVLEELNTKPAVTYLRRIDRSGDAGQGPTT